MIFLKRRLLNPYYCVSNYNKFARKDDRRIISKTKTRSHQLHPIISFSSTSSSSQQQRDNTRRRKSLALSVHFYQPELGMKEYEILSRATAFLIAIDAKDPNLDNNSKNDKNPYQHLHITERKRYVRDYRLHHHDMSPVSGPDHRKLIDLNWLEFVPKEVRPQVHIVCSSHVVSPFLWKEYYPHHWLNYVKQEHIKYTLEVIEHDTNNDEPDPTTTTIMSSSSSSTKNTDTTLIAKLAVNSKPYHHPEGRDIALLHFRDNDEKSSLKLLKSLGIDLLYIRPPDKLYQKGETMYFDGYVVQERNVVDDPKKYKNREANNDSSSSSDDDDSDSSSSSDEEGKDDNNEDNRIFYPYQEIGQLSFHTNDRFFATTTKPLPEGLCGAPVLDTDGDCCGTVEGIVPVTHKNPKLAGSAAFIPSYMMREFIDYVERMLLERMMPKDLFQMVCTAKKTNSMGGGLYEADGAGTYTKETDVDDAYDIAIANLKKRYQPHEVDAILQAIERERDEVLEMLRNDEKISSSSPDGNDDNDEDNNDNSVDLNEIMYRARSKTLQIRELVKDQYMKQVVEKDPSNEKR